MTSGYSGRPLAQKLGIKPGERIVAVDAPANYPQLLQPLPDGAAIAEGVPATVSFLHIFVIWRAVLEEKLAELKPSLARDGMLWISWPKKSAKVETDLNENLIREVGLDAGLVDVKVCAADPTWSGLKFVYRLKDR